MKDLTQDSVTLHILKMAAPVGVRMFVYIAYQLINLHFISRISTAAVAGVNVAMTIILVISAITHVLGVGTTALVSHGAGRKDLPDISLVLSQSLVLAVVCGFGTVGVLYLLMPVYLAALSTDAAVVAAGLQYLWWVCPGYALLFPLSALTAGLRGAGIVNTPTLILIATALLNAVLAFLLIPGRGFIPAFGVAGAGVATTLATAAGLVAMWIYLRLAEPNLAVRRQLLVPKFETWRRILVIGLPAGVELLLMLLSTAVVYVVIRDQGASTQAGFGIGSRVLQLILLPGLAIAVAAGPVAGQNLGAKKAARVQGVFRSAAVLSAVIMLATTALVQWKPMALVEIFETDPATATTAELFLQLLSWTFVAQGLVYTCAYIFQGLGNTMPALLSAMARFVLFSIPAVWVSRQPDFHPEQVWYLLTASAAIQAVLSLWLLRVEFKRTLHPLLEQH